MRDVIYEEEEEEEAAKVAAAAPSSSVYVDVTTANHNVHGVPLPSLSPSTKFCAHERIFVQRQEGELVTEVSRSRQLMLWGELAEKRFMREYVELSNFDVEVLRRQLSAVVGYAYGSFEYVDYLRVRDNFTKISRLFANSVFVAKFSESNFQQLHDTVLASQLASETRELFTELAKTRGNRANATAAAAAAVDAAEATATASSLSALLYADATASLVYRIRLNKPYDSNCSQFLVNAPTYVSSVNTIRHSDRIVNACDNNIREFEAFAFGSRVISHIDDHDSFAEYFQQNAVYACENLVLDADELNVYFEPSPPSLPPTTERRDYETNADDTMTVANVRSSAVVDFSSNTPWQLRLARFLHDCRRGSVVLESSLLTLQQRQLVDDDELPFNAASVAPATTAASLLDPLEETDKIAVTAFLLDVFNLVDPRTGQRLTYDLSFVPKYDKLNLQLCVLNNTQRRRRKQQQQRTEERVNAISSDVASSSRDGNGTATITTTTAATITTLTRSTGSSSCSSSTTTTTTTTTTRLNDYAVKNAYDHMMENMRHGVRLLTASSIDHAHQQQQQQQHQQPRRPQQQKQQTKLYKRTKTLPICATRDCDRRLAVSEETPPRRVNDERSNIIDQQALTTPPPSSSPQRRNRNRNASQQHQQPLLLLQQQQQQQRVPSDDELIAYYNSVDVKTLKRVDPAYRAIFYTFPFKAGHYVNASTCEIVYVNVPGSKVVNEALRETLALMYYNWSSENLYSVLEQSAKRLPYQHVLGTAVNADNLEVLAALLMLVHAQMGAKISITTLSTNDGKHNAIHHRISVRIPYINELYRWVKIQCGNGENASSCSIYNRMANMNWSLFEKEEQEEEEEQQQQQEHASDAVAAAAAVAVPRVKRNGITARISFPFVSDECKNCKFYQKQLAYFADLVKHVATHVFSTWDCVLVCSRYSIPEYLYQDLHEIVVSSPRKLYVLLTIIVQDTNYELYRAYRANLRVNWRVNVDKYTSETRTTVVRRVDLRSDFAATVTDGSTTARDSHGDYLYPENARLHNVTTRTQTQAEHSTASIILPVELDSENSMCVVEKRDFYAYRFADERLERLVRDGNIIGSIDSAEQSVVLAQLYHSWKSRSSGVA